MTLAEANGLDVAKNKGILEVNLSEEDKLESKNLSKQLLNY
jgi:hypothetical protein